MEAEEYLKVDFFFAIAIKLKNNHFISLYLTHCLLRCCSDYLFFFSVK